MDKWMDGYSSTKGIQIAKVNLNNYKLSIESISLLFITMSQRTFFLLCPDDWNRYVFAVQMMDGQITRDKHR